MASTRVFTIAPNPHWVVIDNFSHLPPGAAIYTYRSLNPSVFKPAYQDTGGTIPYSQPIVGFANGTFPPIFWEFDSANPTDIYYIRVYDSADPTTQNFLWDFDGLSGGGTGGGGNVVTAYNLENFIFNGIFFRNVGTQTGTPSLPTFLTIAPSNHAGYVSNPANVNVIANGPTSPDIIFAKNNTTSTDLLSFPDFTPLGIHALPGNTITPVKYLHYECTGAGAGETYKYVQIPVIQGVQSLSNQQMRVKLYARVNGAGNPNLQLYWRQFFGDGGAPSADQIVPIGGPLPLTNNWQLFDIPTNTPDATGKTLGSCLNDALFLQLSFPLSPATTNIDIASPSLYLGNIPPGIDLETNDQVDSIANTPRTGDVRTSLNNFLLGWVLMNDGTIGSAASGGTARANVDTFPLFSLIWNAFSANQALAPMFTSAGAAIAYGANAVADFTANRRLSLTRNLGRVMAGSLPTAVSQAFTNVGNVMTVASTASFITGVPVIVTGGALPTPLIANRTYYAIMINATTMSLATTPENAIAGTVLPLTSNASGTVTVPAHVFGSFFGLETHTQTIAEMAAHTHPPLAPGTSFVGNNLGAGSTGGGGNLGSAVTTGSQGSSTPFNIMQPTAFMLVHIKL